jgi:hypothetical protein
MIMDNNTMTGLDASMKSVPVFTIARDGKPELIPFKDGKEVLMFFLDFDDAVELHYELQLSSDLPRDVEVFSLSLLDFLMFMQKAQENDTKIVFRPHRNSVQQIKLTAKRNNVENMPQMSIPLFFARNKDTYMSIAKDGKDVIPLFTDVTELKSALKKGGKEDMNIDIEFLEGLLGKATSDEKVKSQFVIVPSQCQSIRAEMLYRDQQGKN